MPHGFKQMGEATAGMGTGGEFIKHVRLYDDQESAIIRFLTEAEDVFWGPFHRVKKRTSAGREWWDSVFCLEELGQACELCREEISAGTQFLAWVWQYKMYHAKQVEGSRQVDVNGLIRYEEINDEPRLMRYSHMHKGSIEMRLQRLGTLTDRDYEWIRTGPRGTNRPTYMLEPVGDPTELSEKLVLLRKELPALEDIAHGKVRTLDGQAVGEKKTAAPRANKQVVDTAEAGEKEEAPEQPAEVTQEREEGDFDPDDMPWGSGPPGY